MLTLQIHNTPLRTVSEYAKTKPQYPVINAFEEKQELPQGFQPSEHAVLCARGNAVKNHPGNIRFLQLINENLQNYKEASSKLEKSLIVSSIIDSIRRDAPEGAFVKQERGVWYEVGDHHAREKCGQRLRDLLSSKYSSASASKKRRRRNDETAMMSKLDEVIVSNGLNLPGRIEELTSKKGGEPTDEELQEIFNKANMELLQTIKEQNLCAESSTTSIATSTTTSSNKKNKRKFEPSDDDSSSSSFDPIPFNYSAV